MSSVNCSAAVKEVFHKINTIVSLVIPQVDEKMVTNGFSFYRNGAPEEQLFSISDETLS